MSGEKENILVSACLLGVNCRYDGGSGERKEVLELMKEYNFIPVCPEQLGGMKTPREPSEITHGNGESVRVMNRLGQDVTDYFKQGAQEVLRLGKLFGCRKAILKERSPSCGHGIIYDGTFSGNTAAGSGVTAMLLEKNGITVTGESDLSALSGEMRKHPDGVLKGEKQK